MRQGYDPSATADAIYFNDSEHEAFIKLDQTIYDRIQAGKIQDRRRLSEDKPIPFLRAPGEFEKKELNADAI